MQHNLTSSNAPHSLIEHIHLKGLLHGFSLFACFEIIVKLCWCFIEFFIMTVMIKVHEMCYKTQLMHKMSSEPLFYGIVYALHDYADLMATLSYCYFPPHINTRSI